MEELPKDAGSGPPAIAPGAGGDAQPKPFGERPEPPPGGCSSPLLVGCAAAVVLLGVLILGLLWKAGDWIPTVFRWSLEQIEREVSGRLPDGIGEEERRRLAAAFDAAADAFADGSADRDALQRLQPLLLEVLRDGELTEQQVRSLIGALEAVAAERAPPLRLAAPDLAALAPPAAGS